MSIQTDTLNDTVCGDTDPTIRAGSHTRVHPVPCQKPAGHTGGHWYDDLDPDFLSALQARHGDYLTTHGTTADR